MNLSVVREGMSRILTVSEKYLPLPSCNAANGSKKNCPSGMITISESLMRSETGAAMASYRF